MVSTAHMRPRASHVKSMMLLMSGSAANNSTRNPGRSVMRSNDSDGGSATASRVTCVDASTFHTVSCR